MTNGDKVTIKDLFELSDRNFREMNEKLDKACERISALEIWRANMLGKITAAVAIINLIFFLLWDSIKRKLNF